MAIEKIMTEVYGQRVVRMAKILCKEEGKPYVTQFGDWEFHNWSTYIPNAMVALGSKIK